MKNKNQRILLLSLLLVGVYLYVRGKKNKAPVIVPPLRGMGEITPFVLEMRRMWTVIDSEGDPLNIRKQPTTSSSVVGQLTNDTIFEGSKVNGLTWVAVYDKKDKSKILGFVSSRYVRIGI
jgi:hypothetical protein